MSPLFSAQTYTGLVAMLLGLCFLASAAAQTVRPRPVPVAPRPAHVPTPAPASSPAAGDRDATSIESDAMQMYQAQNVGIFTGNVRVSSKDIRMKCREMQVTFSPPPGSKPIKIVAIGDVDIVEPTRRTKAGRVEYDLNSKVIVLTERPQIVEPKTQVHGSTITLDRAHDLTIVEKATLVMQDGIDVGGPESKKPALPGQNEPKVPTTIVCDHMRMDQAKNIGRFTGSVKVNTKDIKMTCKEMWVTFAQQPPPPVPLPGQDPVPEQPKRAGGKPERILAIGDVDIVEASRRTQSGQADYDLVNKVIVLTVRPEIVEQKTLVRGDVIRIDKSRNIDVVEVEKSTLVLQDGIDSDNKAAQPETLPR
ncbi:MAG: LptA/OstA family protein [Candidatus Methylacidiphilales bacterium]